MSRQQTMPWLCVALACAVPAGAQAPPPCEPHRLIEVVPPTAIEDNQTLTFAVPTVQGEWFLTITRTGDLPRARVRANGAVVARPFDFHRGLRTLRVPLTLTTQNTLQIRPLGPGSLTVRVEGVVPEATVPAGTGLRVARDLEFAALQFQARGYSQSTVELPTTQGLFSLVLEPGGARGVLKWNDETPFQTLRQHQQAAIQPLTINTIRALLLGRRGSALQVRVRGTIVDEDAPQLAWESPANGMTAEPSQPLELTYADSLSGLQVESLRITVDGADVTEHFTVGDNTASATVADLPAALRGPGAHVLVAQILDRACNPATTQVTFVIGGMDTTPPVLTQPANLVLEQAGPGGTVVTYVEPTATDDIDPAPTVVCTPPSGSLFPAGITTVTCVATDSSGNTAQVSFSVTVQDTTAPVLTQPSPLAVEQSTPAGTTVSYSPPTATDAADPNPAVVCVPASGTTFPAGTTTVTCTATDSSGNQSQVTFAITVQDTIAPSLVQPTDLVVEQSDSTGAVVNFVDPAVTDAADPAPVVSCSPASGSVFNPGTTTVTCTARDAAGNTATTTFSVTVQDTTAPTLNQPADLVIEQAGPLGTLVTYTAPPASDLADPAPVVSCSPASGSLFAPGITTVTCTATDSAGNSSAVTFTVTVEDTVEPAVEIVPTDGSTVGATVTARITYSDAGAGVDPTSLVVLLDGADVSAQFATSSSEATATLSLSVGAHTLDVSVADQAGNTTSGSSSFMAVLADLTPPTVAFLRPMEGACVGPTQTARIRLLDDLSGVALSTLQVLVDAVDITSQFAPVGDEVQAPLASLGLSVGSHTLRVLVQDGAGNQADQSVGFDFDASPPALSLTPSPGSTQGPRDPLVATYEDLGCGVDLGTFQALLNGVDVTSSFAIGASEARFADPSLAEGAHVLMVSIRDLAGNQSDSTSAFNVVAPAIAFELFIGPPPVSTTPPDDGDLLALAAEARTYDGTENDLLDPEEGATGVQLLRLLDPDYADTISAPAGPSRPSPRAISNAVHAQAGSRLNDRGASDFLWIWGQFLDHDVTLSLTAAPEEPFPITVPTGDPLFDPTGAGGVEIPFFRSDYETSSVPRQQLNDLTAWIDASMVYGADLDRALALRSFDGTGRLRTSQGDLLPFNDLELDNDPSPLAETFFLAGDIRANENVALLAMHTLFVREHNRLADLLRAQFPAATGDQIYESARRLVGAQIQAITYQEFLPVLLGPSALTPYAGYDADVDTGIINAFSNAAFRLGHSLLSPQLQRLDAGGMPIPEGSLSLHESFFAPHRLTEGGGIEPLLRGAAQQHCQELDTQLVDGVRNFLFGAPGMPALDLASLNIQRGRDHGLPSYNEARRQLGLAPRASFAEVSSDPEVQARLASVYAGVEEIDAWSGGLAEDHLPGAMVGELFHAILVAQFELLRDGDRFWYETAFGGAALQALRNTRLADVIRRNTTIGPELTDDVFLGPVLVGTAQDLTLRAVTSTGAPASSFTGFVELTTSDGRLPLDGLLLELTPANMGEITLKGLAVFQTLGTVVVTAQSLEDPPLDISGNLSVTVELQDPVVTVAPPAQLPEDGTVTVEGISFPGGSVELVVDGQVVATSSAGSNGEFILSTRLDGGVHVVFVRATNAQTGEVRESASFDTTVPEVPPVDLLVSPTQAVLSAGEVLALRVTERFADGSEEDVTSQASYSTSDAAIATVDAQGLVRAVAPGSATITASLDGFTAQVVCRSAFLPSPRPLPSTAKTRWPSPARRSCALLLRSTAPR